MPEFLEIVLQVFAHGRREDESLHPVDLFLYVDLRFTSFRANLYKIRARLGVSELRDALFWSDCQSNNLVKFGEMTILDHPICLIKDKKAQLPDLFGQLVILEHRS